MTDRERILIIEEDDRHLAVNKEDRDLAIQQEIRIFGIGDYMTTENKFIKHPDAVLDYVFDWAPLTNNVPGAESDWLEAGEAIETVDGYTITVSPTGELTVDSDGLINTNTAVKVWLSAGVMDTEYTVTCEITTDAADPRTDTRYIVVKCGMIQDENEEEG